MDELISEQNLFPIYNIKAVSHIVGLLPVTLRAWERRYGLLHPSRGNQGYRMYSEHDLQTLRWVKMQIDSGMSISRAVDHLNDLRIKGEDPAGEQKLDVPNNSVAIEAMSRQLFDSITSFKNAAASETLRRAFAVYLLTGLSRLSPDTDRDRRSWHRGDLPGL